MHQHVLVLRRFRQNIVQILCGPNEIGEDSHQNKHCLQILLKCYENSGNIGTWTESELDGLENNLFNVITTNIMYLPTDSKLINTIKLLIKMVSNFGKIFHPS